MAALLTWVGTTIRDGNFLTFGSEEREQENSAEARGGETKGSPEVAPHARYRPVCQYREAT
jgi:hypothetical protein